MASFFRDAPINREYIPDTTLILSVVDFMEDGDAKPWWEFTEGRKKHDRTL